MPNLFSKHLHLCFFKLKDPTILSHPQPQQDDHHHTPSPSPPSTKFHSNTTFNYHNHSLYDTNSSAYSTSKSTDDYFSSSSSSSSSDSMDLPPPDFASVFASQRFFFSSPGSSNSIIESPDTRPCNSHNNNNNTLIPRGGVRVPKYSLDPYVDFLRSMHEMIDSRQALDVRKDWDYLHELLLCYLALNPTHTHKYIVRAFTDIVVDLLSSTSPSPPSSTPCRMHKNRRQTSFSGRLV
ncbi:transcription repressor OFP12 [Gastrolobium bilobum]|uniref:transcription repressor OFP12 n=1 Tax=Gastrolobium bilobum TaxID=150636 RepID=UPI002AAF7514|nr:transcription repressor OFP12 [Gastrolobium bilobum]